MRKDVLNWKKAQVEGMKTILVMSVKGGVGKSTIADELAFSFERSGIPCSFYDLDGKGGTIHGTVEVDGAEVAVVDCPGELDDELPAMLAEADLVVIPTRPTGRDMDPLLMTRERVLRSYKGPVLYVVNGWNRFNQSRDFLDWFHTEVDRYAPLVSVAQSEVFGQAWARDSSVVAYAPSSRAAGDVLRLVNLVRRTCGFSEEC